MKHSWILLLLGATSFVLLTSMKTIAPLSGPTDLKVEITTIDDLRVQLTAQNETGEDLHLSVRMLDPNTRSLFTETEIYAEDFSGDITNVNRTLNLSKLESGTYRIRIKAGKKHVDRLLDIRTKPVTSEMRVISLQ